MALSGRSFLALCGTAGGTVLLAALVMSPAVAGGTLATPTLAGNGCGATAHVERQRGGEATAVNASDNEVLAPGASTTFGAHLSGIPSAPVLSCDNGATTPTRSTRPGKPDVTVTRADNQSTVTLFVGQTLGVSLGAEFLKPAVSGAALARVSASGGYPTRKPLAALYRAAAPGSVDVTTHSDYACLHSTPPCALPITLWTVHVNVLSGGQAVTVSTADNQSTVRLHVGDTLVVSLTRLHLPPMLSAVGVLVQRDVVGGYPTDLPLVARYGAVTAGAVDVSTTTDIACNHAPTPCPSPQVPWVVHVIVTA